MLDKQRNDTGHLLLAMASGIILAGSTVAAEAGPEAAEEKNGFADVLPAQCLVMKDGELVKFEGDFAGKKLLAVYYSHTMCGSCKVYTKFLNSWYKGEAAKFPGVQLLFATRGDGTRAELTKYVRHSEIRYPVLDEKYYVQADVEDAEDPHPFYSDADMGVPRIRFFHLTGKEIPVGKHVESIYDGDETIKGLSALLAKLKADK